ncbi:MAG: choice-of-anchor D domain-containing protein [Ignavibacteriae bacterium]|nr:choice-of-anchor D domain-containing protein [Ignavibacteriota bacterium]
MKQTYRLLSGVLLFILLLILSTSSLHAQSIVVSEYNYAPDPKNQFTELLVIQDNLSIVGFTLHDNTANLDQWQSGIRFKDISLWKNLRAGTIIVINHRVNGNVTDLSKADGYIEVEADDLNVFDTLTFPSGDNWKSLSLIISQNADIVQILDASGNHVHALSHGTNIGYYATLPQPKLQHQGTITGYVRVYPGKDTVDYSGSGTKTYESTTNGTKGLPNRGASASDDLNSGFWRFIRQPRWYVNPSLIFTLTGDNVHLSWIPSADNFPSDHTQGYIVLFAPETSVHSDNSVPKDGMSYTVGAKIGGWTVLANILSNDATSFDYIIPNMPCYLNYKFRVVSFRYSQDETDNASMSANSAFARGRSYFEGFDGNTIVEKTATEFPDISASGQLSFCSGKSVTLSTTMTGVPLQWTKNNSDIPGETGNSLLVNTSGIYRVRALLSNGCSAESESKEVKVSSPPIAQITASSLLLCLGDSISLFAGSADSYEWIKDGVTIPSETNQTYYAKTIGSYKVIVKNSEGCADTSEPSVITARSISYSFFPDQLDFGNLIDCQSSKLDSVKVQNDTREDIRFETITISKGYSLVSPTLPVTIRDGKTLTFVFRFTPQKSDTTTGYADFVVTPCNVARRITFTGSKDITKVSLSTSSIDFGTILSCDNTGRDTTIEITNNGTTDLVISGRSVTPAAGYSLVNNISFPKTAKPGEKIPITINFSSGNDGTFSSELAISYTIGTCNDTLRVKLQGIITTPVFTTNLQNIDFIPLQACDSLRDTTIVLTNPGLIPLVISKPSSNPNIQFLNLPLVINPNLSAKLRVRFQPISQVNITGDIIPIVADKCNSTTNFTINGSKQGTTFSLSSTDIDFGDVTNCSQSTLTQSISLKIDGLSIGTKVSTVTVPKQFSIDLSNGQSVTDLQQITLSFTPTTIGEFADSIGITFEPCSIVKFVKVHGRRISTEYTITSLLTDFGTVDTGTISAQQTVEIKNTGDAPFHLSSIDGILPPFLLVNSSKPYPVTLGIDESILLTFTYSPVKDVHDSIPLKFIVDKPCDTFQIASLVGTGKVEPPPPPPDTIRTSVSLKIANGTASVGSKVLFPITIASSDIALSKTYKMSTDISYNPRLLMPKAVRIGGDQDGFVASFADVIPGQTRLTIENPDGVNSTKFINPGTLAEFECEALLGDQLTTNLTFSNETFSRLALSTVSITEVSGSFILSGDCALDSRKVAVGGYVTLSLKSNAPDNIELEFETVSEERTLLLLYSSIGSLIERIIDQPLKYGKHSINISISSITDGIYYAVLRSGTSVKVLPIIIQN